MFENLLYILILLAGFPSALYLSKICSDEIVNWRLRLFIITIASFIVSITILFTNFYYKTPVIISLFFIIITNLTIIWKSYK